jgi:hypothetical protein
LWRFFRRRFLRLWVAILWRFRFFPQGMCSSVFVYVTFQFLQEAIHLAGDGGILNNQ